MSSYHSKHKDGMIADVQQRIKNDLKDHVITQRHRDGDPGRLWRCAKPGTNNLSFTVHAPPGWLMITGDMGECMWSRHYDMLIARLRQGVVDGEWVAWRLIRVLQEEQGIVTA